MADIHLMAETGKSIIEPMRTRKPSFSWDEILIKGVQLAKIPLNHEEPVSLETVIGPKAAKPMVLDMPVYVTHMSYGALSREVKIALARGSAMVKTANCSGEGGILAEEKESSYRYIFEYVPNLYSVTEENLKSSDAIEIKFGQSAKPGMGGHLPADKVTGEIAKIRGFDLGQDIISPSHFKDITTKEQLKEKVAYLRNVSEGRPIGIKIAAGHIEADLEFALFAEPDFVTLDGRAGATGAAPKFVKGATSVPSMFALCRARKYMEKQGVKDVSLIITGGLRISPDIAKAVALGADAAAIGTAALMACGCQQYRICETGKCPMGITTQDPSLRARFDIEKATRGLANFLSATSEELVEFAQLTGNNDIHALCPSDLCTTNSEISSHMDIQHV
jgi:glutamate synthase domain-containing protein 2